jgi:hypothetical protein
MDVKAEFQRVVGKALACSPAIIILEELHLLAPSEGQVIYNKFDPM